LSIKDSFNLNETCPAMVCRVGSAADPLPSSLANEWNSVARRPAIGVPILTRLDIRRRVVRASGAGCGAAEYGHQRQYDPGGSKLTAQHGVFLSACTTFVSDQIIGRIVSRSQKLTGVYRFYQQGAMNFRQETSCY
jgi:hypothetical protein